MKTNLAPVLFTAALAGAFSSHAQLFQPFTIAAQGDVAGPLALNVLAKPDTLNLSVTWSVIGGSITPATGTPRVVETFPGSGIFVPNQEQYSITIPNLVLKVSSSATLITGITSGADPGFTSVPGDPAYISLGEVQYTVTLTMPSGTQGDPYPAIAFPPPVPSPVTVLKTATFSLDTTHSLSTDDFSMEWYATGDPDFVGLEAGSLIVDGGKGVATSSINDSLGGTISVVPEASQYALLAGLGLVGFAVWRRYDRTA